ncbi:uncharacterized protein LOC132700439 isoform X2 [Cylas formicarius]|uniref:uncharacterized protein LOC132700439 isoform X2 n=1 Tax=Cylas formicarius TaxID=197179 RepID=UPI00295874B8|nr:uncharacterized protein LOC132700439 isoform X2 [Cylas formicarius]
MTKSLSTRSHVIAKRTLKKGTKMGCGHSKITIYPRKSKSKRSSKKSATPEKTESEEEDGIENEIENSENQEDCDSQKKLLKPPGGPLLAHIEISTSQQDFFRMLDEKIENGPDYNSESESEQIAENFRIRALLKDWETASAGSRSLPNTPKLRHQVMDVKHTEALINEFGRGTYHEKPYHNESPPQQQQQQVVYRQVAYGHPNYMSQGSRATCVPATYPSALQYQAISPLYGQVPAAYPPAALRQYPSYNQCGSPLKPYSKHHTGNSSFPDYSQEVIHSSASHKIVSVVKQVPDLSNGDVTQQKPIQPRVQYQHYNEANDQMPFQGQQPQQVALFKHHSRNYQSSMTIPVVANSKGNDVNCIQRHQYEMV